MKFFRVLAALFLLAALFVAPAFASHVHRAPTSGHYRTHRLKQTRRRVRRPRGQQAIDPERVTQIQQALIGAHYLTGEADGKWDARTMDAMRKLQADNGWQTKLTPDARALVKLGLGPDYSTAINAKKLNLAPAPALGPADSTTSSDAGFIAASGVSQ